ncbi:hypothetical protein YC2023_082904 [Brassica napus]
MDRIFSSPDLERDDAGGHDTKPTTEKRHGMETSWTSDASCSKQQRWRLEAVEEEPRWLGENGRRVQ